MKNIFKLAVLSILIVLAGCTDLQEEPVGILAPEGYYNTASDVQAMINGAYGVMPSSNYYGNGLTTPLQLLSDMVDNGLEYSDYADLSPFRFTPENSYARRIWNVSYQVIAITNSAIFGVSLIDEEESIKNSLEAEARFIRAFVYYHLVRLYGDIPYLESPDLEDILTMKQTLVADVYANIIGDLEYAKQFLSMQHPDGIRSRPSQGTAATALASVHLTLGNWQGAYDNAKWVIDNSGVLDYALEADYQNLFRESAQAGQKEYIFILDFTGNLRGNNPNPVTLENDQLIGPFNGVEGGDKPYRGWSMLVPHMNVYNQWEPTDYRLKVSLDDSLMLRRIDAGTVSHYSKFPDWPTPHIAKWNRFAGEEKSNFAGWRSDLDYPAFRYGEVLLIAAEAGNEIGKTSEAVRWVNQIRARARAGGEINFDGNGFGTYATSAIPADVTAGISPDDFRTLVLEERRIELAFEWKRWYDIVRRDLGNQVFGTGGREPQPNFDKSKHYLLPIPQIEIDLNTNFVQNSGY